ncbi:hypothetical protein BAE42_17085 [Mesorhizobium loti]|uniref:Uncharacterized protein n=1 Tax=Rhizobium loti TaxID=381 RepID=A0A1A5HRC0_RHILI|nr:hypothetical protein BAE39_24365 [Mesorhizobium loti]OBP72494.1 hypothetical protein BAE42_17085 [Mesorhizobium loti]OBP76409.1 hypothetical protein BAE41_12305 [Mesorhizobium loti]OBP97038.1 hypothetical protein BAE38_26045 [Mesorhizobium loti]
MKSPVGQPAEKFPVLLCGTHEHSKEVMRLIRIRKEIQFFVKAGIGELVAHLAESREILGGEADGIEQRHRRFCCND